MKPLFVVISYWQLSGERDEGSVTINTNQRLSSTASQITSPSVSMDRHRHAYNKRVVHHSIPMTEYLEPELEPEPPRYESVVLTIVSRRFLADFTQRYITYKLIFICLFNSLFYDASSVTKTV
jgi:hypothetical protein